MAERLLEVLKPAATLDELAGVGMAERMGPRARRRALRPLQDKRHPFVGRPSRNVVGCGISTNLMLALGVDCAQITAAGRRELRTLSLIRFQPAHAPEMPSLKPAIQPTLSREARILLFHTAKDSSGRVFTWETFAGRHVQANGLVWPKVHSARASALCIAALHELEQAGFVERAGRSGDVFTMTATGLQVADTVGLDADE